MCLIHSNGLASGGLLGLHVKPFFLQSSIYPTSHTTLITPAFLSIHISLTQVQLPHFFPDRISTFARLSADFLKRTLEYACKYKSECYLRCHLFSKLLPEDSCKKQSRKEANLFSAEFNGGGGINQQSWGSPVSSGQEAWEKMKIEANVIPFPYYFSLRSIMGT